MWYCVMDYRTFRILYHGQDNAAAANAISAWSYLASDARYGSALSKAAMEAGYLHRGGSPPVTESGDLQNHVE